MPSPKRRGKRRRRHVGDWRRRYLLSGQVPNVDDAGDPFIAFDPIFRPASEHGETIAAHWHAARDELLPEFVKQHPGRRPFAWWHCEAPEPRLRVGGTGIPLHEACNWPAHYAFGIPRDWLMPGEAFASLLARRGEFRVVDLHDPPRFEGEGAYFERLGLLLPGEKPPRQTYAAEPIPLQQRD
ncbi:MAG: hypothetical protein HY943_21115 [Gammaproteobacteria bacterium]|nr:hypothetical protein [Gammaproteobacteria bacterium]